jgi:hypothetical protein
MTSTEEEAAMKRLAGSGVPAASNYGYRAPAAEDAFRLRKHSRQ